MSKDLEAREWVKAPLTPLRHMAVERQRKLLGGHASEVFLLD
jgi:hypothetical protein